jgi:hypothetical protein
MREQILLHLNNPGQLEKLYRSNRPSFRKAFTAIYPELKGNTLAQFWYERLNYEREESATATNNSFLFVIIATIIAGCIAKLPVWFPIDEEFYYPRNIGFILFPVLSFYFAWKNKMSAAKIGFISGAILLSALFINLLPDVRDNDTLILACMHLVLFLWSVMGFAFVGDAKTNDEKRLRFLKFNGDLVVITTLIVIAAGIVSGITIGLFKLIGYNIEEFYFENIVMFFLPAAPILGTYLTQTNPQLVGRVSPVIARIFSPIVLIMLVIYLGAMAYSGKDPYNDREFLLIFNALLIGVMAIIFFSVAETKTAKKQTEIWILALLSLVTVIVNAIALSAIVFRIAQFGITPNRAAVLGGDILILVNLLLVTVQLVKVIAKKNNIQGVGKAIASFLPVYFVWAAIVTFIFPFVFGLFNQP